MAGTRGRAALNKNRLNTIFDYAIKWCVCAIIFAAPFSKSISEIAIVIAITAWASKKIINRDCNITCGCQPVADGCQRMYNWIGIILI